MKKQSIILLAAWLTALSLSAQEQKNPLSEREGYKEWTRWRTAGRVALGVQRSFYTELGVARHKYMFAENGFAAQAYYAAFEWTPTTKPETENHIFGIKTGYEINAGLLALGLEAKYLFDKADSDFVITPKVGMGFFGVVNIFYGFNISTNDRPFSRIGKNQFSVNFNLNKFMLSGGRRK
jgi:hypothetical protein